jgi:hypothetical protein
MSDKSLFDPEKISMIEFRMIKGQVDTPEDFDNHKVIGFALENALQLGFSLEDKMAKADFTVSVKTQSQGENETEAIGNFHLMFIYKVENLEELAFPELNKQLRLDSGLSNALSSVTYSTSRGILLTRLQGTALNEFVLPIINPNKLLQNRQE